LIRAINRAADRHNDADSAVPFVLIGHSKLFSSWNERSLRPFLAYIVQNKSRFLFGTFDSLKLASVQSPSAKLVSSFA
jgi:hypothetical protein